VTIVQSKRPCRLDMDRGASSNQRVAVYGKGWPHDPRLRPDMKEIRAATFMGILRS
jgi:hypothetical protein